MSVNEKMTAIAEAIRGKTGGTEKLGLDAMVSGIDEVYEKGKQAEYRRFWDNIPDGIDRYTFAGGAWNAETFRPNKTIICQTGHPQYAFARHNYYGEPYDMVEQLAKYNGGLNIKSAKNGDYLFYQANISRLPTLNMSSFERYYHTFEGCSSLVTIDMLILSPSAPFSSVFTGCTSLANIMIDGEIGKNISFADSPSLTTESVQSIIDHLKNLTGGTAQTLTVHALVGADISDEQKAVISAKNWTLVY